MNFTTLIEKLNARRDGALAFVFGIVALLLLLLSEHHILMLNRGSGPALVAVFVLFLLLFALALFLLYRSGLLADPYELLYYAVPVALAFAFRAFSMGHVTADYANFLAKWVEAFRVTGGVEGLSHPIGNYNIPYLYILALISYSRIPDLYLIKLVSILFDVLMAYWSLKLAAVLVPGRARPLAAFLLVLLLPTVILNGSYWGQCDSIYGAFAVLGLYLGLSGRPGASVAAIALAFAFKLQAVFILPVYCAFLFTRRIRVRHILIFPAVYFLSVLPAVLMGRPLLDTITIYMDQAETYTTRLTMNAPSLFSFFPAGVNVPLFSKIGILVSFVFVAVLLLWVFFRRKNAGSTELFLLALLFAVGVPLLLPFMHERYFFLADVLSLVLACAAPRRFFLPIMVSVASISGYYAYLKLRYLFDLRYGALLLLAAAVILLILLYRRLHRPSVLSSSPVPAVAPPPEI